jgi:hypothetical protein
VQKFERKILRKINGPTKLIDGIWRIKANEGLDKLIEHKNIIHFIKAQRLRRLSHVERMPEDRDVKKIKKWKLIASRPVGLPKIRWMDNVMKDIQAMKIVKWKMCAQDRNKWKSVVEQAKTHSAKYE